MPNKWNKYVLFPAKVQYDRAKLSPEAPAQAQNGQIEKHVSGTQTASKQ